MAYRKDRKEHKSDDENNLMLKMSEVTKGLNDKLANMTQEEAELVYDECLPVIEYLLNLGKSSKLENFLLKEDLNKEFTRHFIAYYIQFMANMMEIQLKKENK